MSSAPSPWFTIADSGDAMALTGAWRLAQLAEIEAALRQLALTPAVQIDGSALEQIDSAAALVLWRALRARRCRRHRC